VNTLSIKGEEITVLTKNLVRYKIHQNTIAPRFISTDDKKLLNTATQLLAVFDDSQGKTRGELTTESTRIVDNSDCNVIIARGLEKLLMDRTLFNSDTPDELIHFRHELFLFTARLHAQDDNCDLETYYQRIEKQFDETIDSIQDRLYSDLPVHQPVTQFKALSAKRLLHRYNCAQVQGLLIHCARLVVKIFHPEPASLRQLFKYLRFHQLLAEISKLDNQTGFKITIDGPLNLFFQTQKYGLNLANFFPGILHQKEWQMQATIHLKKRKTALDLTLDNSCQILSHYNHFMAYIPDEINSLQDRFKKKFPDWSIAPSESLIPLPGDSYCFPDFTLSHQDGQKIHLELFHAWHKTPLMYRLQQLDQVDSSDLLLGVNKRLLKDPAIASLIEESNYFKHSGFLFRDMPTVNDLRSALE